MSTPTITNPDVSAVFESCPPETRNRLLWLRQTIFDVAAATTGVGALEETLKWGQISYLTPATNSGTTIRIDAQADESDALALYVHCQTTLVETFRTLYPDVFEFEGNRCIKFAANDDRSIAALQHCIELALTYHQRQPAAKPA